MAKDDWFLKIILPENRYYSGVAILHDGDGVQLMPSLPCLGKADNGRAAKADNPQRSPILPYGDTPLGTYKLTKIVTFASPHGRIGKGWFKLIGVSGPAFKAMNERTGLGGHAGRGSDGKLRPTYGCIRFYDNDWDALTKALGDRSFYVVIIEGDPAPLCREKEYLFNRCGDANPDLAPIWGL